MSNLRRHYLPGHAIFLTTVCRDREPLLRGDSAKQLLLACLRETRTVAPFRMRGYVILDDHIHLLLTPCDADFSRLMRDFKNRYAHRYAHRFLDRRRSVWQRRFWDHLIRDRRDMARHLDYIHYNPVKHGYVDVAADYPYSSLRYYIDRGIYDSGWGLAVPASIRTLDLD